MERTHSDMRCQGSLTHRLPYQRQSVHPINTCGRGSHCQLSSAQPGMKQEVPHRPWRVTDGSTPNQVRVVYFFVNCV